MQNTSDLEKYSAIINEDQLPLHRGYRYNSFDLMIREVLMGAKLLKLDLKGFRRRHGAKLQNLCASTIKELETEDLIKVSKENLELTKKGILYGDYVSKVLADALQAMA